MSTMSHDDKCLQMAAELIKTLKEREKNRSPEASNHDIAEITIGYLAGFIGYMMVNDAKVEKTVHDRLCTVRRTAKN